jgi:hypothetical protein
VGALGQQTTLLPGLTIGSLEGKSLNLTRTPFFFILVVGSP